MVEELPVLPLLVALGLALVAFVVLLFHWKKSMMLMMTPKTRLLT